METLLRAHSLTKSYGERTVVRDISLELVAGSVTALIGPNGAGKSTIVRMLVSMARPTSGHVEVLGKPYDDLGYPGRSVGAIFDNLGLNPGRTARQHLRILAAAIGARRERITEVAETVGIAEAVDRRIRSFSLGMRQRLALAGVLLGEPRVLLLDEPVNGLDPAGIQWVRNFLLSFAKSGGAVLLTSHLLGELEHVADDVVLIDRGHIRLHQSMETVLRDGSLEQAYMAITQGGGSQ